MLDLITELDPPDIIGLISKQGEKLPLRTIKFKPKFGIENLMINLENAMV
jgi:hypothetical protein